MRLWWLVVENGNVDLCQSDPGHDVDLYVASDVPTMAKVWIGKESLARALESDAIEVIGDRALQRTMGDWLMLAQVAEAARRFEAG